MELVVFDLDGTLLDRSASISAYTRDTLAKLARRGIAYTVATGRTRHGAASILEGHEFPLPQVYKNGVMIWDPARSGFSHQQVLTVSEVTRVIEAMCAGDVAPFVFTSEVAGHSRLYHVPSGDPVEAALVQEFVATGATELLHSLHLPASASITHISAIGPPESLRPVEELVRGESTLVAYAGTALEGPGLRWIDVHHAAASKGGAVDMLRAQLGATRVVCFGDGDNDLSMFERADEGYAPENALAEVKALATAVIGHHDDDGVARFLRERFALD